MSFDATTTTEPYVRIEAIADFLDSDVRSVARWITTEKLPSHKIGRSRRFKISEVDIWAKARCTSLLADRSVESAS